MPSLNPQEVIYANIQLANADIPHLQALRVEAKLGEGGMAEVHLAQRLEVAEGDPHQFVAMKILHQDVVNGDKGEFFVNRFLAEANTLRRFSHPNIATFVGSGTTTDGRFLYLAEFIQGYTLSELLRYRAQLCGRTVVDERSERVLTFTECTGPKIQTYATEVAHVKTIMAAVLSALVYSHARGVVHRDLKLDNVMIEISKREFKSIKVVDFGIAKIQNEDNQQNTKTGTVLGTPEYMAPEQMLGYKTADHRMDLYAAGLMCLALLSGLRFMNSRNPQELAFCASRLTRVEASFDLADYVEKPSEAIRQFILKATQFEVDDRFQSAEEMLEALEEAFDGRISDPAFAATLVDMTRIRMSMLPQLVRHTADAIAKTKEVTVQAAVRTAYFTWHRVIPLVISVALIGAAVYFFIFMKSSEGEQFVQHTAERVQSVTTTLGSIVSPAQGSVQPASRTASVPATESATVETQGSAVHKMNSTQLASFTAGEMLLRSGQRSKALKIFLELESNGVEDPVLLRKISDVYASMKERNKAKAYRLRASR